MLVTRVSDRSLAEFLEARLADALGVADTRFLRWQRMRVLNQRMLAPAVVS